VAIALTGCGGDTFHNISGIITFEGEPLEGAAVTFVPRERGNPAVGVSRADGRYTLETGNVSGIRPGEYKVVVVKNVYAPYDERTGRGGERLPSPVPDRYARADTTDLTITVPSSEAGAYDIKIKK
jgi:hypothetical protein